MPTPLWFRIVKDYPLNKNGPTIPFLLGSIRDHETDAPADGENELRELLDRMDSEAPKGYGVQIEFCGTTVGAHVAKVVDGGKGLLWKDFYGHDVHDIVSLGTVLWALYRQPISSGYYSKNGFGAWEQFSTPELTTIRRFKGSETYPF